MKWDGGKHKKEGEKVRICAERYGYLDERPESIPIYQCDECGRDLYDGDEVYMLPDGSVLCFDDTCLLKYVGATMTVLHEDSGIAIRYGEDW